MKNTTTESPVCLTAHTFANGGVIKIWDDGCVTLNGLVLVQDFDDLYAATMTTQGQRSATDKLGINLA